MVMDAKEIQSDLHSLRRLYGLLSSGSSNVESNGQLDGHARFLLKNLLDTATKRVLKIVAGQGETPDTVSPAEQQQPAELSIEQEPIPLQNSLITADYNGSGQKVFRSEADRNFDGSGGPLWKEKSFVPQLSQAGAVEQPIQHTLVSGHEYRRRCRVCQRNTVKHLETKEGMPFYSSNSFSDRYVWNTNRNESKGQNGLRPFERKSSGLDQRGCPSDWIATDFGKALRSDKTAVTKLQEVDVLAEEAYKAIEQIETGISAFHLGADPVHPFEGRSGQPQNCTLRTRSESSAPQTQYGPVPSLNLSKNDERRVSRNSWQYNVSSQRVEESVGQTLHQAPHVVASEIQNPQYLSMGQTSNLVQPPRAMWEQSIRSNLVRSRSPGWGTEMGELVEEQNVKAIIDKIETGNWIMGYNDLVPSQIHAVQNFTIPANFNGTSYTNGNYPATYPSTSGMRNLYQSHMGVEDDARRYRPLPIRTPGDSVMCLNENKDIQFVDPNLNISSNSRACCRTCPSKDISSQHQGFHKHQQGTEMYKDGISRNRNYMTPKAPLPYPDSDFTTDSYASPCQQTNSLYSASETEQYSLPDNSRDTEYATSRTSSETGTLSLYTSHTVDSENPSYYSSTTCGGAAHDSGSSSCIRSVECSSQDQSINRHAGSRRNSTWTTSKRSRRGWTHRSSNLNNSKKQRGVWKRIKDKLAVIFHHHHHHHHHHHNRDERDNVRKKINRNASLRMQRGREVKAERAVEKMRKSPVLDKNQKHHFRGLMGGFLRHVRHSRKFKQGTQIPIQMAKSQHNGRKASLQKPNGFQLPQQHKGPKLPKKAPLNLELGKKKTPKALPKLK